MLFRSRQLVLDEIKEFESVERAMIKVENNLVDTVRYNLTKDYIVDHNPVGIPVSAVKDRVDIDGAIITPKIIDKVEAIKFADKFKRSALLKAKANGDIVESEYRSRGKDNEIIWAKTIAVFVDSPKDKNEYALIYTYDITEKKNQEHILQHIINTNYDFIAIIDTKTPDYITLVREKAYDLSKDIENSNQHSDIQSFPYMTAMKYFVKNYCLKSQCNDIINAMSIDTVIKNLGNENLYSCSYIIKEKDERKNKIWQFSYFDEDKTKIIYSRCDVTEIFKAEMEAKAQLSIAIQNANEASEAKSEFLSRMSHDMRTPMNSVINFAEIGIEEKDLTEKTECLQKIKESGNYLLGLINDVLDMSRIEEGKITLHFEPYYYEDFQNSLKHMLLPKANEKDIELVFIKKTPAKYG